MDRTGALWAGRSLVAYVVLLTAFVCAEGCGGDDNAIVSPAADSAADSRGLRDTPAEVLQPHVDASDGRRDEGIDVASDVSGEVAQPEPDGSHIDADTTDGGD